jgi:hypothetical protein
MYRAGVDIVTGDIVAAAIRDDIVRRAAAEKRRRLDTRALSRGSGPPGRVVRGRLVPLARSDRHQRGTLQWKVIRRHRRRRSPKTNELSSSTVSGLVSVADRSRCVGNPRSCSGGSA